MSFLPRRFLIWRLPMFSFKGIWIIERGFARSNIRTKVILTGISSVTCTTIEIAFTFTYTSIMIRRKRKLLRMGPESASKEVGVFSSFLRNLNYHFIIMRSNGMHFHANRLVLPDPRNISDKNICKCLWFSLKIAQKTEKIKKLTKV